MNYLLCDQRKLLAYRNDWPIAINSHIVTYYSNRQYISIEAVQLHIISLPVTPLLYVSLQEFTRKFLTTQWFTRKFSTRLTAYHKTINSDELQACYISIQTIKLY